MARRVQLAWMRAPPRGAFSTRGGDRGRCAWHINLSRRQHILQPCSNAVDRVTGTLVPQALASLQDKAAGSDPPAEPLHSGGNFSSPRCESTACIRSKLVDISESGKTGTRATERWPPCALTWNHLVESVGLACGALPSASWRSSGERLKKAAFCVLSQRRALDASLEMVR